VLETINFKTQLLLFKYNEARSIIIAAKEIFFQSLSLSRFSNEEEG